MTAVDRVAAHLRGVPETVQRLVALGEDLRSASRANEHRRRFDPKPLPYPDLPARADGTKDPVVIASRAARQFVSCCWPTGAKC